LHFVTNNSASKICDIHILGEFDDFSQTITKKNCCNFALCTLTYALKIQ